MFADGLGLTSEKIERQVTFIGDDYGGVAGRPAAINLARDIARDIFERREEYEKAATRAPSILTGIPDRNAIEVLYRPFVKPLIDKNKRETSNWLVWAAKFWHHLNSDAFPIEESRVDAFFKLNDYASVDKYMKLLNKIQDVRVVTSRVAASSARS